jgi:tRNAThr (cytosine32-N3)-methyltransferase
MWWNKFYTKNTSNFFKNRKWLFQEFPMLRELSAENGPESLILEVGAGAGNTAFPVMQQNRNTRLRLHACDFSIKAVEIIQSSTEISGASIVGHFEASLWDVASLPHPDGDLHLPDGIEPSSVDVVILVFVFSALAPSQWEQAIRNIWTVLKPGGIVLFRDYGRGDLAQVRFKAGRFLEDNFYVRGDGTRVYFFDEAELKSLWSSHHKTGDDQQLDPEEDPALPDMPNDPRVNFDIVDFGVDRRMLVNRKRRLKMYRCWMQAVFKKPVLLSQDKGENISE